VGKAWWSVGSLVRQRAPQSREKLPESFYSKALKKAFSRDAKTQPKTVARNEACSIQGRILWGYLGYQKEPKQSLE